MKYGILASSVNTGADSEIICGFVAPLSVLSNQPAYTQDMMSLKRNASSQRVQRWEIEANIEPSVSNTNYLTHSVINGHDGVFYVRMPQVYGLTLTTAARTVSGDFAAGVDTVTLSAAVNTGEFIQFAGDAKVYLVAAGGTSPKISPPLLKALTNNQSLITSGAVTMLARYDDSVRIGITYIDGVLSDPGSIKFIEALE